jgi:hypothetical protein
MKKVTAICSPFLRATAAPRRDAQKNNHRHDGEEKDQAHLANPV